MKKLILFTAVLFTLVGTMSSCGKSCTKGGWPSVRVNRDDYVSDQDYNDAIANLQSNGYTCQ